MEQAHYTSTAAAGMELVQDAAEDIMGCCKWFIVS